MTHADTRASGGPKAGEETSGRDSGKDSRGRSIPDLTRADVRVAPIIDLSLICRRGMSPDVLCDVCLFRSVCFPGLTLGVSDMCSFGFRPLSSGCQAERLCPPDDRWAAVVYHRPLLASIHEHVLPKPHIGRGNATNPGKECRVEPERRANQNISITPVISRNCLVYACGIRIGTRKEQVMQIPRGRESRRVER